MRLIALEPGFLHQAAAGGSRGLLILAGKIITAEARADLLERDERLVLRMENLAGLPGESLAAKGGLDDMLFPGLRNRRKGDDLPFFLCQDVADEIVFVQAL